MDDDNGVPPEHERTPFWLPVAPGAGFRVATRDDLAAAGWTEQPEPDGSQHFKDYHSGEKTYKLAVQVSGPDTPLRLLAAWPSVMEQFGLMPRAEAEAMIEWLVERLTPQAKAEIQAAVQFADRFPKLVPGKR